MHVLHHFYLCSFAPAGTGAATLQRKLNEKRLPFVLGCSTGRTRHSRSISRSSMVPSVCHECVSYETDGVLWLRCGQLLQGAFHGSLQLRVVCASGSQSAWEGPPYDTLSCVFVTHLSGMRPCCGAGADHAFTREREGLAGKAHTQQAQAQAAVDGTERKETQLRRRHRTDLRQAADRTCWRVFGICWVTSAGGCCSVSARNAGSKPQCALQLATMDQLPLAMQELLQAGPSSSSQPLALLPSSKHGLVGAGRPVWR